MQIPSPAVRALSGYWLWCSAKGTPPIHISITKSDTELVKSTGFAKVRVYDEGTYKCNARNEAGIDSKEIQVSFPKSKFFLSLISILKAVVMKLERGVEKYKNSGKKDSELNFTDEIRTHHRLYTSWML